MRIKGGAAVLTAAGALVLTGCVTGIGTEQRQPTADPSDPVQDAVTHRWYTPAEVTEDPAAITAKLPQLQVTGGISLDGRFTDPYDRVPVPTPDDYWWQAVVVVGEEHVAEMIDRASAATASDGGGDGEVLTGEGTSTMNEPAGTRADDSVISGVLMGPLQEQVGQCPTDWILLGNTFTADETYTNSPVTADRLVITTAAVCEGGDRIVVDALEF